MGLFNLLKKEPQRNDEESEILLAMPMFNNGDSYDLQTLIENLKTFWNLDITAISGDNDSAGFVVNGQAVGIAFNPVQIPWGDIEETAQYAYNWINAAEDLREHTGHAIVVKTARRKSPVDDFRILSKILCSILMTSNAVGVYQGSQSLLIPKEQYLSNIEDLQGDSILTHLWIDIGLREYSTGNCGYTYGLKDFHKTELEVINSELDLEALFELLSNIAAYVIGGDIRLKPGETLGYTKDQKIRIGLSKGVYVDGQSLKLEI